MLNKQLILTGALTAVLVAPMQAKAGWPTIDIAKATAYITETSARYQPAAAQLQRIEQVLETLKTIQATATAAMAGDLKAIGQNVAPLMKRKTFTGAAGKDLPFEKIAKNGSSPEEVSNSVWDTYFLPAGTVPTKDQIKTKRNARSKLWIKVQLAYKTKALYYSMMGPSLAEKQLKALQKTKYQTASLQDAVNAGTVAQMAVNFERLNQISMRVAQLQKDTIVRMNNTPYVRYSKPQPPKFDAQTVKEMGDLKIKDEADVDLQ